MDREATFATIRGLRLALCDQFEGLSDDQWNSPSLCDFWRVREVLGHLVSIQAAPTRKFVAGTFSMRCFHRRADRFAHEYGRRDPAELVLL